MMAVTAKEILTALFDNIIEGLVRLGCGLGGLSYPIIENDYESK
jgi:hypothetical protein